jgi:integrase
LTFAQCTEAYLSANRAGWGDKQYRLWASTLAVYAEPVIGALPVQSVAMGHILKVVEPIWTTKPETAARVRAKVEAVLDWAGVHGHRAGDNPARWRGHLAHALPASSKVHRVEHRAALPFDKLANFMKELRDDRGIGARALEWTILTCARAGETLGAVWSEIDLDAKLWAIPAARMKMGRDHRVPLSDRALAILGRRSEELLFPGRRGGRLGGKTMLSIATRHGVSVHGFRSTFRDWVAERTDYPGEMAELALAHAVANKVEAAYRRGDMFEKRRAMMTDWAKACGV